jgi:alpha-N-arabinofuranosidase
MKNPFKIKPVRGTSWFPLIIFVLCFGFPVVEARAGAPKTASRDAASIDVDAAKSLGKVSPYVFGQNIEHEHGTISGGEQNLGHEHGLHTGGLWAEMLRDRKFEEGDIEWAGVANGWVPEEMITNHYWELSGGQGKNDRYRIDRQEYYGGGASQTIEVYGDGSQHASIYQVGLHFTKNQKYIFYLYLKRRGSGGAWVEFEKLGGPPYARQDFPQISEDWEKYTASFTAPEDTDSGRVRIGVQGNGVFWIDSASLMPADNYHGMRRDVIEALKPLAVPVIRYPGGCFADTYHWKDGIGPRDRRPERWSPKWQEWEPNDFGIDEFMDFAEQLGSEAQITTDYLSGTAEEAGAWVEYTNGSAETAFGRWRAENGRAAPYGIKLWAVGNEAQELCSDDYIGANRIEDYIQRFHRYKAAMQKADPTVRVMAVGAPPGPLKWNRDMFELMPVDLLGVSIYTGEGGRTDDYDTKIVDLDHFYRHVVAEPLDFDRDLGRIIASIGDRFPTDRPLIAVTEYQAWWLTEKVDEDFRLCNALYLAGVFHALMRRSQQVLMGELESLINVQGIVEVSQTSVKLTPEYFACLLYRHHTGSSVLATSTESPMTSFNQHLPALDSLATLSADGHTVYLAVVNRNEDQDVSATIRLGSWKLASGNTLRVFELNGKDKVAANPFGSSENVNIQQKSLRVERLPFSYRFPAHSVTVLEVEGSL